MSTKIEIATAGAGSGKTTKLTVLIREAIQRKECRPSAIIATTFTTQASAELAERVRRDLCEAGLIAEAQALAESLLGTVHSICARLLRRFAFEAGISPCIQVLDEEAAQTLMSQAVEDACGADELDELERLAERLGQMDSKTHRPNWKSQVSEVSSLARENAIAGHQLAGMAHRSADELLAFFGPITNASLDQALYSQIQIALDAIAASGDDTTKTRAVIELYEETLEELSSGRLSWSKWPKITKAEPAKASRPAVQQVIEVAAQVEAHLRLQAEVRSYIERVFGVAERAIETYQARKEERGFLDYADLEVRALELLAKPEVAEAITSDFDLLLVDECQDTNPLQLALFLRLSNLVKGRTVLVGDPKQAIYGFRGSDPDLLEAVLAMVRMQGGVLPPLATTYRARPELSELFNALFIPAFKTANGVTEAEIRLRADRTSNVDLPRPLERWILSGGKMTKGSPKEPSKARPPTNTQAAAALAEGVVRLMAGGYFVEDRKTKATRPLQVGDVAVLSRSNDAATVFAEALIDRGIPVTRETAGLVATPEVRLAMACLRRLLDPSDTLASAEIIALVGGFTPEEWLEDRLAWVDTKPEGLTRWGLEGTLVESTLVALEALRSRVILLTPAEALDAVITAANLFGVVSAWGRTAVRAAQRRANLEALRGLALNYEDGSSASHEPATLGGFLLWCQTLGSDRQDAVAMDEKADAVKVMTWHGSKGLEWPVVICADLELGPRPRIWDHVLAVQGQSFDACDPLLGRRLRFWPWPFGGQQVGIPLKNKVESSPEGQAAWHTARREELRLLYVGFTRTRDLLVLPFREAEDAEWLQVVQPALLVPATTPELLQDEEVNGIKCRTRRILAQDVLDAAPSTPVIHWFPTPLSRTDKLIAQLTPSGAKEWSQAAIGATVQLGKRLPLRGKFDEERLGNALHGILASELLNWGKCPRPDLVQQLLTAHGVGNVLAAGDALAMVQRLRESLTTHFHPSRVFVEVPFQYVNAKGQRVSGIIDLLLETAHGWVIIDHKSFPGKTSKWAEEALSYSGQLHCYNEALVSTNRPVYSTWIHFCAGGGLVEVVGLTSPNGATL